MTGGVSIKADIKRAERIMSLSPKAVRAAGRRTINKVAGPAKTEASRSIRDYRNLRAKDVKDELRLSKARRDELTAVIAAKREQIPLHKFKGTRQTKKGVSVAQVPGNRSIWESAFMPWGKDKAVFKRTSESRYPIQFQVGPGVGSALDKAEVRRSMNRAVDSRWNRLFRHELDRELEKATRRARRGV